MFENGIDLKKTGIAIAAIVLIIAATFLIFSNNKNRGGNEGGSGKKPELPINTGLRYVSGHQVGSPDIATQEICDKKEDKAVKEDCFNRLKLGQIFNENKNLKECLSFTDLAYRNQCLSRLINNNYGDVDICKKISDYSAKERCVGDIAIKLKDKSICEEFKKEPYEYQECKDRVDAFSAPNSKKGSLGKVGEVEEVEIKECAKIKTLEYSKLCVGNVLKDGKMFVGSTGNQKFLDNYNDFYFYRIATTKEECAKIVLKGAKDACLAKIEHPEFAYFDFDKDGINDDRELWFSTDPNNSDTDGDGLNDREEILDFHTNPTVKDTDNDGLTDYAEIKKYHTDPNNPDTDGDGTKDGNEVNNGTDPNTGDADADGLSDIDEAKFGTDKNNPDTDGDGMSDLEETRNGFNPLKKGQDLADTDGDGLLDIDEMFYGTDRFNKDTDKDGLTDKEEVDLLLNPLGKGDMDFDKDGLTDKDEKKYGTNPTLADTDNDGLSDFDEIFKYKTDPLKADTDGDSYKDGDEIKNGFNPLGAGKLKL